MWVSAKLHVVQFKAPLPRVWSFKRTQEILELNSSFQATNFHCDVQPIENSGTPL